MESSNKRVKAQKYVVCVGDEFKFEPMTAKDIKKRVKEIEEKNTELSYEDDGASTDSSEDSDDDSTDCSSSSDAGEFITDVWIETEKGRRISLRFNDVYDFLEKVEELIDIGSD